MIRQISSIKCLSVGDSGVIGCRLFYLVGQLGPGGLERQLYNLVQAIDRGYYKPAIVVWNYHEEDPYVQQLKALRVPLYFFPPVLSRPAKLIAFRRFVGRLKPEVVHSYSFYTNFAASWATWGTQAVAIGSVRSDFAWAKKETGSWLGNLSAYWPRDQICNNSAAIKAARRSCSFFVPRRLFAVRNGLDLERFRVLPSFANGQTRIVGIGSLFPIKRWDRLLIATSKLKRNGFDFQVQIVGDGPLRGQLEQAACDLRVSERVEFLGYAEDIPSVLARATFLVHPSDNEGCPNVVMEAMACGRAVIATGVGDVPALVEDGKTGFVVRRGDDTHLTERMANLITDRALCWRMGEAARAKAEREFGVERLVSETLAAYQTAGWKG